MNQTTTNTILLGVIALCLAWIAFMGTGQKYSGFILESGVFLHMNNRTGDFMMINSEGSVISQSE